ncbi:axial regulator YABBY 5-like isoform X2 [Macadamia integrifolia]|uniref:axial regulator YABBY 5-like isoform X2 n=1 Tax=Macadamia integrifolia TaxID=60698 RepID=UPI001C4FBE2D|nr:axial regulator YABBY 5-like isoform X2 [Macadamia integrifolia]
MSACNSLLDLQEQICYVHCGFCNTILLVSVPCSSLFKVVTVRCGHCGGHLSVNMMRASFFPLHVLASLNNASLIDDEQMKEFCAEEVELLKVSDEQSSPMTYSDNDEEKIPSNPIVNKPPEKRQRAPSAYNHFIKEEIKRLKAREPNITHKEAFSTAAKNWAHFPRIQYERDGESCSQGKGKVTRIQDVDEVDVQTKGSGERKAKPRQTQEAF